MKFHNNRSHNLTAYLKQFGWEEAGLDESSDFSLWDTYNKTDIKSVKKVWPKEFYSIVDCLWTWHKRLEELYLTDLAPLTITDWEKYKLEPCDFKKKDIWFFKQIFGVHGKGINLFSTFKEYQTINQFLQSVKQMQGPCLMENLKHHYVLQKGVFDTHLIDGRKYILRVYSLTLGRNPESGKIGETYIYNDCFYYTAIFPLKYDNKACYIGKNNQVYPLNIKNKKGKTYVPAKQMRTNVHVSHWHIQREGKYNIIDNRKMGILTDLPEYKTIMRNLFENVREMSALQEDILDEYVSCENKPFKINLNNIYQIWGSDYIVEKDLSVKCLEINAFPNLSHGDPYQGKKGSKKRPHEIKFRKNGFDRDLMRRLGYDLENLGNSIQNNWVLVNSKDKDVPINDLYLQKQNKISKNTKKKSKK